MDVETFNFSMYSMTMYRNFSKSDIVSTPNETIKRVGSPQLLSEKFMLMAIANAKDFDLAKNDDEYVSEQIKKVNEKTHAKIEKGVISVIDVTEANRKFGRNNHFYEDVSDLMGDEIIEGFFKNSWKIYHEDKGQMIALNIISGTIYDKENKKIIIIWEDYFRDRIIEIKGNYTELNEKIIYSFRSIYSLSIYKFLKSELDKREYIDRKNYKYTEQDEYEIDVKLEFLKFLSGYLTFDTASTKPSERKIQGFVNIGNFSKAEEERIKADGLKGNQFRYTNFRTFALKKHAYKEINGFDEVDTIEEYEEKCKTINATDIHMRYEPIRGGKGGKVQGVRFFVRRANPIKITEKNTEEHKEETNIDDIIDEIREIIDEKLKTSSIRAIAKAADYDIEKVRKAYEVAKESRKDVENLVGFMISAIKNEFESDKVVKKGSKKKENSISNRKYDFDELEKEAFKKK